MKSRVLPNTCEGGNVRQVTTENELQDRERRQRQPAVVTKKDELMAALPLMPGVAKEYLSL